MQRFGVHSIRRLVAGATLATALAACTQATFNVQPQQLPNAAVGQAYEVVITATYPDGSNVQELSLSTTGSFPPGLQLRHTYQGSAAAIYGTPTAAGTYSFTLRAGGEYCTMAGCPFGVRDYTLVVTP